MLWSASAGTLVPKPDDKVYRLWFLSANAQTQRLCALQANLQVRMHRSHAAKHIDFGVYLPNALPSTVAL